MELKDRFLKYVSFDTQSDENSTTFPSTDKQLVLLNYLADEMRTLGLQDVTVDKYGYAMGTIPASEGYENVPVIGFISHVDTSPDMSGKDVKPRIIESYDGEDIILNASLTMKVADFAYTMDGSAEGELEYENFNAAAATIEIQGRNVHPGYAKDKMINAIQVACELNALLPAVERPEHTTGYEGFYHCVGFNATVENAKISYIIRDHDSEKFEQKKVYIWSCVDLLQKRYGEEVLKLTLKDQYFNMRKMVEPHPQVIDKAIEAMRMADVEPLIKPIRGGTDGARLSFMGLPCPNIFTGGMNFHGKFEYCSLNTMQKAFNVIINLAQLWAK